MKRRFILRKNNKIGYNFEGLSHNNVILRSPELTDEFYTEKCCSSDDGEEAIAFTDPVRMLFAQERINNLGAGAIENWLQSLQNFKDDPLQELRKKCSDKDLISIIKSRHIQQPCEVMAWAQEAMSDMEKFTSELKAVQEQQVQITAENVTETPKPE